MRRDIEREKHDLAGRIAVLERNYGSTGIRSLDFVIDALNQWTALKGQINGSHRELRREVTVRHNGFLPYVAADFILGMDRLMDSYEEERSPTPEFIQGTYDKVRKCLELFLEAGLHSNGHLQNAGIDIAQKYGAYMAFEQRLQKDLAMLPQDIPRHNLFDGTVKVLNLTFPIALIATNNENVNWSYANPDSRCRLTGKNVRNFHRPEIALVLAEAYINRMRMQGEQINQDPATLAGLLLKNHQSATLAGSRQSAIDAMQSRVLDYRRSYGK